MSIETTARLAFPLLAAGQAQKELVHNEALALLDIRVSPSVEAVMNDPPASPMVGQCWIVGAAPSGVWIGHTGAIACWVSNGWRFASPHDGMRAWVVDQGLWAERRDGSWAIGASVATEIRVEGKKVLGARQPDILDPANGATIDAECRAAVVAILSSLRAHGLIGS